ncbi:hypothetical protein C8R45DRAFT_921434 [Mycena sanguinolenta]|nr:hypothetical protein C8R45DRAFT_921434 [Mycena sanguinolenta]
MTSEPAAEERPFVGSRIAAQHRADSLSVGIICMEEGHAPSDTSHHDRTFEDQRAARPKLKVTPWRLFNTVLVLGLGIFKAVAAYRGEQTAPTTLDWILGVLWAVIAYWLSFLEQEAQLGLIGRWFFTHDLSWALWPLWIFLRGLLRFLARLIGYLIVLRICVFVIVWKFILIIDPYVFFWFKLPPGRPYYGKQTVQ